VAATIEMGFMIARADIEEAKAAKKTEAAAPV
jgi:hypothetical protein